MNEKKLSVEEVFNFFVEKYGRIFLDKLEEEIIWT